MDAMKPISNHSPGCPVPPATWISGLGFRKPPTFASNPSECQRSPWSP
jgi:hypothetical protein